jgi:hypothetical protein
MMTVKIRKQQLIDAVWVNPASGPLRIIWKFGSADDWKQWRQVSKNCRHVNDVLFLGDWIKWAAKTVASLKPSYHDNTIGPNADHNPLTCTMCADQSPFRDFVSDRGKITYKSLRVQTRRVILVARMRTRAVPDKEEVQKRHDKELEQKRNTEYAFVRRKEAVDARREGRNPRPFVFNVHRDAWVPVEGGIDFRSAFSP